MDVTIGKHTVERWQINPYWSPVVNGLSLPCKEAQLDRLSGYSEREDEIEAMLAKVGCISEYKRQRGQQ